MGIYRGTGSSGSGSVINVTLSDTSPAMDSVAAAGTGVTASRGDHVHPTDTTRAALTGSITQDFNVQNLNGAPVLHWNDITNGRMLVDQLNIGTAGVTPVAGNTYHLDGWYSNYTTGAAPATFIGTVKRVAGSTIGFGSNLGAVACQVTFNATKNFTNAADYISPVSTAIEGVNLLKYVGNTFTIGFRARFPTAGTQCVSIFTSNLAHWYIAEVNCAVADTVASYSITITGGLPATTELAMLGNASGLNIVIAPQANTTYGGATTVGSWQTSAFKISSVNQVENTGNGKIIAITDVTLNLGTSVSVSEIPYEQELDRCQRYAKGVSGKLGYVATSVGGLYGDVNTVLMAALFDTKGMRTSTPTIKLIGTQGTDWAVQSASGVNQTGFTVTALSDSLIQCVKTSHGVASSNLQVLTTSGGILLEARL